MAASNPQQAAAAAMAAHVDALSQSILQEMVQDVVYGLSCEEFRLALERKLPCPHCGRHCRDLFYGQYVIPCSRQPSQQAMPLSEMPGGTSDNMVQIDCLQCQRSIASTRYAQHLSECMGLTGRKRRAPMSRTATNTSNSGSNSQVHTSPYLTGDSSEDDEELGLKKRKKTKGSNLKKEQSGGYSPSPLAQTSATYDASVGTPSSSSQQQQHLQLPNFKKKSRPAIVISDSSSDGG